MTSIPQNLRYLPHTLETRYHAVKNYQNGASVAFIYQRAISLSVFLNQFGNFIALINKHHICHMR